MTYAPCKPSVKRELHPVAFMPYTGCAMMRFMAKSRTYLREWRTYRHLTQEQVLERLSVFDDEKIPTTAASLSRIETGKQIYTQRILEALASIYEASPSDLLGRDPTKEGKVIDMLAHLTETDRERAIAMIAGLARAAEERQTFKGAPDPDAPLNPKRKAI